MKKLIIGFSLILFSATSNAQVYQCKINGSLKFQDKPCAGSKEQINQIRQKQNEIKQVQAARERYEAESEARAARGEPRIGMTTTQVGNSAWGHPQKYSETQTAYGGSEFWHYGSGRMIHFRNGVVVAITK